MMPKVLSQTPAAIAMRAYRKRLRAARIAAGLQSDLTPNHARMKRAQYIYRTTYTLPLRRGGLRLVDNYEGRVTVDGAAHIVSRSIHKYGARDAYTEVLNQVAGWLLAVYPEDLACEKIESLLARTPQG